MRPVWAEGCNFTYKLVGGTEENDLPCLRGAGFVTSFWEPDGSEIEKIVLDGRVVIWIWWPSMVGLKVGLTDTAGIGGRDLSNAAPIKAHPYEGPAQRGWAYVFELDDEERSVLHGGAKIKLTVDATPPPPVSVTPYEEDEAA